jgi:hypothetical protein
VVGGLLGCAALGISTYFHLRRSGYWWLVALAAIAIGFLALLIQLYRQKGE